MIGVKGDNMGKLAMVINGLVIVCVFFFQAEDVRRDLVRSRELGDVYKRHIYNKCFAYKDRLFY